MLQSSDLEIIKRGHTNRLFGSSEYSQNSYHGDGLHYFDSKNGNNLYTTLLGGDYEFCFVSSFNEKSSNNQDSENNPELEIFTEIFRSIRTLINVNLDNFKPDDEAIRRIYFDASEFINKLDFKEIKIIEDFGPGNLHILILLLIRYKNGLYEISDIVLRECSIPHYTAQYLIIRYLSTLNEFKGIIETIEYAENYDKVNLISKSTNNLLIHHIPTWLSCEYLPDLTIYSNVLGEVAKHDLDLQMEIINKRYQNNKTIAINGGLFKAVTDARFNFGYGKGVGIDILESLSNKIEDLSSQINLSPPRYTITFNKNLPKNTLNNLSDLENLIENELKQKFPNSVWLDTVGIIINSQSIPVGENIFNCIKEVKREKNVLVVKGELNKEFLKKIEDADFKLHDIIQYSDYIYVLNLKND